MYCPKCAALNDDAGRFCRSCGLNIEALSLALSDTPPPHARWLEKYGESKSKVMRGSILLTASLLIGVIPAIFFGKEGLAWLAIWTAFFSWMACWGVISLSTGLGAMAKAKTMLRETKQDKFSAAFPPPTFTPYEPPALNNGTTSELQIPRSVTEGTTKLLGEE